MRMILIALMLLPQPLFALDADEMFKDPALEERARYVGRQLRCLKCRNQSIFDSNAGIAKDLRIAVRERIVAGDSDNEILDFVSTRFGDYVLLKPPMAVHTYALWLAPGILVLIGIGGLAIAFRRVGARSAAISAQDRAAAKKILKETS